LPGQAFDHGSLRIPEIADGVICRIHLLTNVFRCYKVLSLSSSKSHIWFYAFIDWFNWK